jgi:signal transduction histidine kinase
LIFKERLTWIFWEALCLVLVLSWLWRDEKKRHKDEVVRVLLKERGEFIQNVSHQLKTPLAILTNSLESHHPSGPDWSEVKNEVHHLTTVVEDMLLLAQVDAIENLPLRNEDILELVGSAVEMAGTKSKMSGVQIRFNVDEKLLHAHHRLEKLVMGELLKSAILNLIDNALDFSPTGGRVDVSVSTDQGRVVIGVKDQGPGVPVEFIPKLFQRFSRGDRARSGSGLGLAITKKIVDLHNGSIELADNTQGAYFEIRL